MSRGIGGVVGGISSKISSSSSSSTVEESDSKRHQRAGDVEVQGTKKLFFDANAALQSADLKVTVARWEGGRQKWSW